MFGDIATVTTPTTLTTLAKGVNAKNRERKREESAFAIISWSYRNQHWIPCCLAHVIAESQLAFLVLHYEFKFKPLASEGFNNDFARVAHHHRDERQQKKTQIFREKFK